MMSNFFEAFPWAPYVFLALASLPALSGCMLVRRMILFRRDREVAREMAKSDPAFEKVVAVLNPKHLLFNAVLCFALSCVLLGIAIFWSRVA